MEDSESDTGDKSQHFKVNAFGHPKTSRHNRPPRSKKILEQRERVATRKSKRISAMSKAKRTAEEVSKNVIHKIGILPCEITIFQSLISKNKYSLEIFLMFSQLYIYFA